MDYYNADVVETVYKEDIIISGINFGAGSSRKQAVACFETSEINCIIAKTMAEILFRDAINEVLLLIISPDFSDYVLKNIEITSITLIAVDFDDETNNLGNKIFNFSKLDDQAFKINKAGSLDAYAQSRPME